MNAIAFLLVLISRTTIHTLANAFVPSATPLPQQPVQFIMATSTSPNECDGNQPIIHRYDSPFFSSVIADKDDDRDTPPTAMIVLNTPIQSHNPSNSSLPGVFNVLWNQSTYRICADGGANRLYEATVRNKESCEEVTTSRFLPDLITGDLDSLYPHVREYYEKSGVPVVRVEDQDYHDLDVSTLFCFATMYLVLCLQCIDSESMYLNLINLSTESINGYREMDQNDNFFNETNIKVTNQYKSIYLWRIWG